MQSISNYNTITKLQFVESLPTLWEPNKEGSAEASSNDSSAVSLNRTASVQPEIITHKSVSEPYSSPASDMYAEGPSEDLERFDDVDSDLPSSGLQSEEDRNDLGIPDLRPQNSVNMELLGLERCDSPRLTHEQLERLTNDFVSSQELDNVTNPSNSDSEEGCTPRPKVIYHIISYHIISYHIISYHIISYHIISYHIISYHIISYHSMTYHIISCAAGHLLSQEAATTCRFCPANFVPNLTCF